MPADNSMKVTLSSSSTAFPASSSDSSKKLINKKIDKATSLAKEGQVVAATKVATAEGRKAEPESEDRASARSSVRSTPPGLEGMSPTERLNNKSRGNSRSSSIKGESSQGSSQKTPSSSNSRVSAQNAADDDGSSKEGSHPASAPDFGHHRLPSEISFGGEGFENAEERARDFDEVTVGAASTRDFDELDMLEPASMGPACAGPASMMPTTGVRGEFQSRISTTSTMSAKAHSSGQRAASVPCSPKMDGSKSFSRKAAALSKKSALTELKKGLTSSRSGTTTSEDPKSAKINHGSSTPVAAPKVRSGEGKDSISSDLPAFGVPSSEVSVASRGPSSRGPHSTPTFHGDSPAWHPASMMPRESNDGAEEGHEMVSELQLVRDSVLDESESRESPAHRESETKPTAATSAPAPAGALKGTIPGLTATGVSTEQLLQQIQLLNANVGLLPSGHQILPGLLPGVPPLPGAAGAPYTAGTIPTLAPSQRASVGTPAAAAAASTVPSGQVSGLLPTEVGMVPLMTNKNQANPDGHVPSKKLPTVQEYTEFLKKMRSMQKENPDVYRDYYIPEVVVPEDPIKITSLDIVGAPVAGASRGSSIAVQSPVVQGTPAQSPNMGPSGVPQSPVVAIPQSPANAPFAAAPSPVAANVQQAHGGRQAADSYHLGLAAHHHAASSSSANNFVVAAASGPYAAVSGSAAAAAASAGQPHHAFNAFGGKKSSNSRSSGADDRMSYQSMSGNLDMDDDRTTMMLRNIPNKYTQGMLLQALDEGGFQGRFNFFYLPIDFRNSCNMGYAFINFLTPRDAKLFQHVFHKYKLRAYNSPKVCEVSYARVQGYHANIEIYRNSPVNGIPIQQYRPLLFHKGEVIPFPPPNAPLPPVQLREQRSKVQ